MGTRRRIIDSAGTCNTTDTLVTLYCNRVNPCIETRRLGSVFAPFCGASMEREFRPWHGEAAFGFSRRAGQHRLPMTHLPTNAPLRRIPLIASRPRKRRGEASGKDTEYESKYRMTAFDVESRLKDWVARGTRTTVGASEASSRYWIHSKRT